MSSIKKNMMIQEIFEQFPEKGQKLAQEMTNIGLHCVGCGAATWETLEAGMLGHGFAEDDIETFVGRLNEIIQEPIDATTITFTRRAAEKFKQILQEENKEGWALRFGDKPGGCGGYEYILDFSQKATDQDQVFTSHGIDIHVSRSMVSRLLGCEIDHLDALQGAGFKVTNPNVKSSCSCGNSQSY